MGLAQARTKVGVALKPDALLSLGGDISPAPTQPGTRITVTAIGLPGDPAVTGHFASHQERGKRGAACHAPWVPSGRGRWTGIPPRAGTSPQEAGNSFQRPRASQHAADTLRPNVTHLASLMNDVHWTSPFCIYESCAANARASEGAHGPMKMAYSWLGIIFSIISMAVAVYVVQDALRHPGGGWMTLRGLGVLLVTVLSQVTCGLMREWLGR